MILNNNGKVGLRYDTKANWEKFNPILDKGEMIVEQDNGKCYLKVGDGKSKYSNLEYIANKSVEWSNNCEHANKADLATKATNADNATMANYSKQSYYTVLNNGTNLNEITTAGWYSQSLSINTSNNSNMPEQESAFFLYVMSEYNVQFWFKYNGRVAYTRWYKTWDNIGWQPWKQIYNLE